MKERINLPQDWKKQGNKLFRDNGDWIRYYHKKAPGPGDTTYYRGEIEYSFGRGRPSKIVQPQASTERKAKDFVEDKVNTLMRKMSGAKNLSLRSFEKESLNRLYERVVLKESFPSEQELKEAEQLVKKLNQHAFVPIQDEEWAAELIAKRLKPQHYNSQFFKNLSRDKSSGQVFQRNSIDPSWGIFFVNIRFAKNNAGNTLGGWGKSVDNLKQVIKDGKKLNETPIFSLRSGKIEEGNHRVAALDELGYKSVPVFLDDAW